MVIMASFWKLLFFILFFVRFQVVYFTRPDISRIFFNVGIKTDSVKIRLLLELVDENGRMDAFNNDLVIHYLDKVVVKDGGCEVTFKAGEAMVLACFSSGKFSEKSVETGP